MPFEKKRREKAIYDPKALPGVAVFKTSFCALLSLKVCIPENCACAVACTFLPYRKVEVGFRHIVSLVLVIMTKSLLAIFGKALMSTHLRGLGETFATLLTRERFVAGVSAHVIVQRRCPRQTCANRNHI